MDLDNQSVEIKQEIEKCDPLEDDTTCVKLEEVDPVENPHKSIKEEHSIENWSEFDCTTDPVKHVKMEDQAADQLKFEELESCINKFEDEDTPELVQESNFQIESKNIAASDLELDSTAKKAIWERESHVINSEAEKGSYICYNCSYKTCCKNDLINHVTVDSCNAKNSFNNSGFAHTRPPHFEEFVCTHCHESFKNKVGLDSHIVEANTESVASVSCKVFKCTSCCYKTAKISNFKRHIWKHTGVPSSQLKVCIQCGMAFKSKQLLDEHVLRKHPKCIESVSSKIHECKSCNFRTTHKTHLEQHMSTHHGTAHKLSICKYCNATFNRKTSLDSHILRKHPNFIASVSCKIHECTNCDYKSSHKNNLNKHMLIHASVGSITCKYCSATFKHKLSMDDHILKKHPNFIESLSCKIHECTNCYYKTANKNYLNRHRSLYHGIAYNSNRRILKYAGVISKSFACKYCDATFKTKRLLDDHVLNKHSDTIASVSVTTYKCSNCTYKSTIKSDVERHVSKHHHRPVTSKMHECSDCPYKTARKDYLAKHVLLHRTIDSKISTCTQCKAIFKDEQTLGDHIIKDHPHFIASIPCKIFECIDCAYKTTFRYKFTYHMMKHTGKLYACSHCDASFKSKQFLEDHILKKHPNFITSVPRKVHECMHCAYKTVLKGRLVKHMIRHIGQLSGKIVVVQAL